MDDILAVVNHYFMGVGDPGYDQKYARSVIPETAGEPTPTATPTLGTPAAAATLTATPLP